MRLGRLLNFMKSLTDQKIDFKATPAGNSNKRLSLDSRQESGIRLLQMFLTDGSIRGITPDGRIYEHEVSLGFDPTLQGWTSLNKAKRGYRITR